MCSSDLFECVPVFLDENSKNQRSALNEIGWPKSAGAIIELSGAMRRMPNYYASIGLAKPIERPGMPCYCIEAASIRVLSPQMSVLYLTSWCTFGRVEGRNLVTEFFDAMSLEEQQGGIDRLRSRTPTKTVHIYYDSLNHPYDRYPKGNEELDDRLRRG